MKEIFLPFRYEDCRALLFDLFALQLLDQWQCAVMIQKLSCKASLKPPHPFTHTGPGHLFCLSFISSRLLGSADLCALTTTYPVTSSPSLDATNLNTSMVTITHTYTVNIPTYKSSVDEKGLEDKKPPKKHTWLVGTMSRRPCMALSFHMCVNLCVYVSVVNWWCGISKVTCMFTCSSVFFFFFLLLMVDEVQSRIGKVRKDTKGQTGHTKRKMRRGKKMTLVHAERLHHQRPTFPYVFVCTSTI